MLLDLCHELGGAGKEGGTENENQNKGENENILGLLEEMININFSQRNGLLQWSSIFFTEYKGRKLWQKLTIEIKIYIQRKSISR